MAEVQCALLFVSNPSEKACGTLLIQRVLLWCVYRRHYSTVNNQPNWFPLTLFIEVQTIFFGSKSSFFKNAFVHGYEIFRNVIRASSIKDIFIQHVLPRQISQNRWFLFYNRPCDILFNQPWCNLCLRNERKTHHRPNTKTLPRYYPWWLFRLSGRIQKKRKKNRLSTWMHYLFTPKHVGNNERCRCFSKQSIPPVIRPTLLSRKKNHSVSLYSRDAKDKEVSLNQ